MDHDADFSAFAVARWAGLVRSAVFLGCSLDEAHDLAQTTLLRCYTARSRRPTTVRRTSTGCC